MAKSRFLIAIALALATFTGLGLWIYSHRPAVTPVVGVSSTPGGLVKSAQNAADLCVSEQLVAGDQPASSSAPLAPVLSSPVPPATVAVAVVATPATQPIPVAQSAEVRSSRAMYMAHKPLRAPEVADPDSEANRRVLQTMVEKALQQQRAHN